MNDQCGTLLLNYEIDQYGNVKLTGQPQNNNYGGGGGGGYRPPSNPNPNDSSGAAFFGGLIAFCVSMFFGLGFILSLIIAIIAGFYVMKSNNG